MHCSGQQFVFDNVLLGDDQEEVFAGAQDMGASFDLQFKEYGNALAQA